MATLPISGEPAAAAASADTYMDFSGLQALKRAAAKNDPAALRKVAQQFESMFTRMMLKSMRDAVGTDPIFGSDQQKMYQGMYDDQLAVQLSHGKGLGLADMLVRQLQRLSAAGSAGAAGAGASAAPGGGLPAGLAHSFGRDPAEFHTGAVAPGTAGGPAARGGSEQSHRPGRLGNQLGPKSASGRQRSFQQQPVRRQGDRFLEGPSVQAATTEVNAGGAVATRAPFRSYADATQSFQDYVSLLRNNPRYAGALNTGSDARAFATGLQRGGYATDPEYAHKVSAIANNISGHLAMALRGLTGLKSGAAVPITVTTSTL